MFSSFRASCVLGFGAYMLLFFLLEKKTGIPFLTKETNFYIVGLIGVIILIVVCVIHKDDEDL